MKRSALLGILGLLLTGSSIQLAGAQTTQTSPTAQSSDKAYDEAGHGNYPRVTQLEQDLLGKTYVNDPLPTRVSRLEVKQFGKASTADLCDRLDKLDEIVKPKSLAPKGYVSSDETSDVPQNQAAAGDTAGGQSGGQSAGQGGGQSVGQGGGTGASVGSYPRVTELERQFLGKTYTDEDLVARLNRLETKKFNKTFPDDALVDRIDRLDKGAEKTGALAEDHALDNSSGSGSNGSGSSKPSIGSMIGKALLGLAGIGGGGGGGGCGPGGGMGMGGLGMMMGRGGIGGIGGPGGMGMGMGGSPGGMNGTGLGVDGGRGRRNNANNAQAAAAPPAEPINPFLPGSVEVRGNESRTAVLEKFVFGKEYIQKPIEQRVTMLEKRLVPYEHNDAAKGLSSRIDHLWSILSAANSQPSKKTGVDQ